MIAPAFGKRQTEFRCLFQLNGRARPRPVALTDRRLNLLSAHGIEALQAIGQPFLFGLLLNAIRLKAAPFLFQCGDYFVAVKQMNLLNN